MNLTEFQTMSELKAYAEKLTMTIMQLQTEIKNKDEKIKHLEEITNVIPNTEFMVEDKEIEICKMEINRLYQKSCRFPLEDKEIRNLEILVKTLATAKGKSLGDAKEKEDKKALKNTSVAELVELAKRVKDG